MLFLSKRKLERIANRAEQDSDKGYWSIVRRQFYSNRLAVWALRVFYVLIAIALMADFIANERPLYCQIMMEQEPVELSNNTTTEARLGDTITIALGEIPPLATTKNNRDKTIDRQLGSSVVTTTQEKKTTHYQLVEQLPDSSQRFVALDTIVTTMITERIDSVPMTYFPVFRQYLVDLGLATWDDKFVVTKWLEQKYLSVLFPPITYSPTTRDAPNGKFKSPFDEQVFEADDNRGWHYLGTDRIGQDVAAGMIHGTRTAMLVGIVAMSIALLIGIFLGALSGYFGDDRLKTTPLRITLHTLGVFAAFFYTFITNGYYIADLIGEGRLLQAIGVFVLHLIAGIASAQILSRILELLPPLRQQIIVPMDLIVMRLIEIVNSIPTLVLILAIVGIVENPSVLFVMVIIGLVSWTGIAKFVRAELLRVRNLEYIEAAQALGYSEWRIISRHALPNALAPVLIAVAFGIASAILTEAFLSFIGVGIPDDQVTWGSLLRLSQDKFSAWWLAIFPGLAIFITVTVFSLIGEGLTDALDPKQKE